MAEDRRERATSRIRAAVAGLGIGVAVAVATAVVAMAGTSQAQTPSTTVASTTTISVAPTTPTTVPLSLEDVRRFEELHSRIDDLQSDRNLLLVPLSILVGLLAAGGAVGIVTSFRNERRTGQAHELLVAAETSSQMRTEQSHASFLQASQQTITLVNETLTLAREASEQAARTLHLKAEQSLAELDAQAEEVINDALIGSFKQLVLKPSLRSRLVEVATEVNSVEGYLQLQGAALTPACLFVKGMDRHLRQEPRVAVRSLRMAAQEARNNNDLAALAQYWIGYESNNQGKYQEAIQVFRSASAKVPTNRATHYDLLRIQAESRFFDVAERAASKGTTPRLPVVESVLETLEQLLAGLPAKDDEFASVRRSVHSTIANVLVWAAGPGHGWPGAAPDPEFDRTLLDRAVAHYRRAGEGLWARFGRLEAQYQATGETDVDAYEEVMRECDQQLSERVEPRSLSNLHKSRMIAQVRAGRSAVEIDATHRDMQTSLSLVDYAMTIFSQFEKRNLKQEDFVREVTDFYERSRAAREQAASPLSPDGADPAPTGAPPSADDPPADADPDEAAGP